MSSYYLSMPSPSPSCDLEPPVALNAMNVEALGARQYIGPLSGCPVCVSLDLVKKTRTASTLVACGRGRHRKYVVVSLTVSTRNRSFAEYEVNAPWPCSAYLTVDSALHELARVKEALRRVKPTAAMLKTHAALTQ